MSIIKRYQAALRHRTNPRYMTKDFIVPLYTGTEPDILDDSNTQRESSVYKEFPNDMPIISPKRIQNQPYEQLELADGGSVERRGFASGSPSKLIGRYKIDEKKLNNLRQYLKSLPKDEIILASSLQKEFDVDRGTIKKIVTREFSNQLKLAGDQGSSINIKKVNIEKSKRVEENISKIKNDYVKDLKTKFKYPSGSFKAADAGVSNSDLAIKYFGSDNPTNIARVERLNARFKNEYELKYPKGSTEETSLRRLERKEESRKYLSDVEKDILKRQESQKKLLNNYFKNNPKELLKNEKLKSLIDVSLTKEGELDFTPRYKTSGEYINLSKEGKLFDVFHTSAVKGEKRNIEYPVNRNIGPSKFNQGFIKQIETFFERTKDDSKYDLKKQTINNYLDSVGYRVQVPDGTYIGAKALSAIDSKTGRLPNIEKTLENLNLPKLSNTSEYIPPKKIAQFIGSIGCPTYAIGGRVNFSDGSDCFNKGLKALEEGNLTKPQLNVASRVIAESGEEGTVLKNILNKAGTGIKFTGRGVTELISIGGGPAGVIAGAALETAFALPYLAEGDYKQALRQSIFGQVPELLGFDVGSRSEDVLKIAKEAGANYDLVKKYVELEKNMREQDEIVKKLTVLDQLKPRYANNPGGVADIDLQIKRLENKLKPSEEYLNKNVYSPKEFNQFTDEYLKAGKYFINKNYEKTLPIFNKSEEAIKKSQSELFKESVTPIVGEDQSEKLLKQKGVLYEEPVETEIVPEELPSEYKVSAAEGGYIDYIKDYNRYARGGRIHLSEGGKGPKIGRRGFLGFLAGAAAMPFVAKFFKGKKGIQAAKVVGKVLPKVSGMPEWFSPLVSRIQKEGIDVSPKATRVEDIIKVKKLEVPAPDGKSNDIITMTEYPDGRIDIEANVYGGAFDSPFSLEYRPPRSDINLDTGAEIKSPGDFTVVEQRPRPESGNPGKIEIDYESMSVDDTISDLERLEKIGTGKRIHPRRVQQRAAARKYIEDNPHEDVVNRYPDGEIYYDQMKDEGLLDD